MKVFKFGGASVKDAEAVRNVKRVLDLFRNDPLVVVISAMGKSTNALEKIVKAYFKGEATEKLVADLKAFHAEIAEDLFEREKNGIYAEMDEVFEHLQAKLDSSAAGTFDFEYDQIVSFGEILSTKIVSAFLEKEGLKNCWLDARKIIRTDNTYRDAYIDWEETGKLCQSEILPCLNKGIAITQGFIGHTKNGLTTTLGREGSDFSAAVLAFAIDAEEVIIWKDVPGMLNADPRLFPEAVKLDHISYREAIELSYFGASVIHPKTVKPLQNKNIPLRIKSFIQPEKDGSIIQESRDKDFDIPSIIVKKDQVLINIVPRDFSFIVEKNLSEIFDCFAQSKIRVHVIQNSAIKFSACFDYDELRLPALMDKLEEHYEVNYQDELELLTIRHYNDEVLGEHLGKKEILLEQKSRHTARYVRLPE